MNLADPAHVRLTGEEGERLSLAIRHLQHLNADEMWREFDNPDPIWHWGADYPGRWIATMALLGDHTGTDYGAQEVARKLISYQRSDGSYGDFTEPHGYKEWFGMGRGLVGLIEYFEATSDTAAMESAKRLGEYYLAAYPRLTPYMYECYSNALEGIVALARLTGEDRFLQFAHEMAETSMVYQRVWQSNALGENGRRSPCGGQVHCQLMTSRGLLDLAELSGEMRYVASVLEIQQFICDRSLSLAGGVGIYFNRPEENEACADADWLRLNLQLWRMTGEVQYLQLAENTLLNQIPFSQASNGGYCYLRGLQNRSGNVFDVCCSHHVPRAIWEVLRYATTSSDDEVSVNLHLEGATSLEVVDGRFGFSSERSLDGEQIVWRYKIEEAPDREISLFVRVPGWASPSVAQVEGVADSICNSDVTHQVRRLWQKGDVLRVQFANRPKVIRGHTIGRQVMQANEAAVEYGPRVYAISDVNNTEIDIHTVRILVDNKTGPRLSNRTPDRFEADGISIDGDLCKLVFSPISETGGNPNGIGRSHPALASPFRVWIGIQEAANGH